MKQDDFDQVDDVAAPEFLSALRRASAGGHVVTPVAEPEVDRAWVKMEERLAQNEPMRISASDARPAGRIFTRYLAATASAAVLMIIGLRFTSDIRTGAQTHQSNTKTYVTLSGQKATVTLDDGSRIILAPESRLTARMPENGGAGERRMEIDGQAMFVVVHDTKRPFTVKSGNTVTNVLGTSFVVRKYSDDRAATVVVTEGKVSVAQSVIVAGQGLQFEDNTQLKALSGREISASVEWTAGRLTFDETPIPQALKELSRWYGVEFHLVDESLKSGTLTATLTSETLTPAILSVLSEALDRRVELTGRVVTISANKQSLHR